ncbi:MAG TPA: NfeD family protein [Acetobacteraceae bacterium]|jgi:membrane protein implicated in regulation of membrane protease activity|nr:NfeD family protein [Acetobacteraceae bacterium]
MSAWTVWLLAGLALAIAEALLPGAFLIWIGLAAAGTGLVTLAADLRFELQVILFAVLAAGSLAAGLRLRRQRSHLNTRHAGLAGRTATALAFRGREGRVRLGDSDWAARLPPDATEPAPGAVLRVVDVDGTVLIVRPET